MAFTVTPYTGSAGNMRTYHGTFTSALGDSALSLNHGFNYVAQCLVSLEPGGIATQRPSVSHSGGTTTVTWDDTLGYSGNFFVVGR